MHPTVRDSVGIDHIVDKLLVPNFTMREARAQFFGANRKEFLRVLYLGEASKLSNVRSDDIVASQIIHPFE